jgi:hypothetical protein
MAAAAAAAAEHEDDFTGGVGDEMLGVDDDLDLGEVVDVEGDLDDDL